MNRSAVIANDPMVEEAAQDLLVSGGSAVGAVLAGFFAAAGAYSGVLLGPITLLVGGIGSGVRAFDGRVRQPGIGTKRPRGFTAEETIPDASRVGAPGSVAAAVVALAYDGGQKLRSVLRSGISRAERCGAPERAALLRRVAAAGAVALNEPSFVRPVLRVAGLTEGGLLTPSDFATVPSELDLVALEYSVDDSTVFEAPAAGDLEDLPSDDALGIGCAVCAVDVRGVFAGLCYRRVTAGFALDELELEAPLAAVPVQRGVARCAPGAALPAPAPLLIRKDSAGALVEVAAAPLARRLDPRGAGRSTLRIVRDPRTLEVRAERG